jgi:hypothetical protein
MKFLVATLCACLFLVGAGSVAFADPCRDFCIEQETACIYNCALYTCGGVDCTIDQCCSGCGTSCGNQYNNCMQTCSICVGLGCYDDTGCCPGTHCDNGLYQCVAY